MSASRDVVESTGRIVLNGEPVEYRAVCRDFPVRNSDGSVAGTMFSCSYIRTDVAADANRPVLFAFNGGPGSSALWLHMGLLPREKLILETRKSQTRPRRSSLRTTGTVRLTCAT